MKKFLLLTILLTSAIWFTGCATTGTVRQIPNLTQTQITGLALTASEAVNQLEAADAITTASAAKTRAQIVQYQSVAVLASNLVDLVNQLLAQQAAVDKPVAVKP